VRVHDGAEAGQAAHAVRALAFTLGRDIVFTPGRYAPETAEGRRLVAHELAHAVQQEGRAERVLQRTPFPEETPELEARRRAAVEGANSARERLVDALARGYLWRSEGAAEGGVYSMLTEAVEPLADRERRLRKLIQDLIGLARDLESGPIPAEWLEAEVTEPGASFSAGNETAAGARWTDVVMFYAHRQVGLGMTTDEIWLYAEYIQTEPIRTSQIARARISPRGINIGAWIVVPDPENAPLDYYSLTGFEEVRGQIFEI
jgi:uncharacterized protein DUF4157